MSAASPERWVRGACPFCGYKHHPGYCPRGGSDWGGIADGLKIYTVLLFYLSLTAGLWALLVTP